MGSAQSAEEENDRDTWIALTDAALPVEEALAWAGMPGCGAVVTFVGTVRDHAEESGSRREGVTALEYEAYEGPALERLRAVAAEARTRWPVLGRIALLHRLGRIALGDGAVVVVVSAPHRAEAFDAARFAIDTLKASVPIWKKEEWSGGTGWGTGAVPIETDLSRSA